MGKINNIKTFLKKQLFIKKFTILYEKLDNEGNLEPRGEEL